MINEGFYLAAGWLDDLANVLDSSGGDLDPGPLLNLQRLVDEGVEQVMALYEAFDVLLDPPAPLS